MLLGVTNYTSSTVYTSARDLELFLWRGGLEYPHHSVCVRVASVDMARRGYALSASAMLANLHTIFSYAKLGERR